MFTVYKIIWDTGEFYFGLTGRTLQERFDEHRNNSDGNSKVYRLFNNTNSKYSIEGEKLTENEAQDLERQLIERNINNPNCINER